MDSKAGPSHPTCPGPCSGRAESGAAPKLGHYFCIVSFLKLCLWVSVTSFMNGPTNLTLEWVASRWTCCWACMKRIQSCGSKLLGWTACSVDREWVSWTWLVYTRLRVRVRGDRLHGCCDHPDFNKSSYECSFFCSCYPRATRRKAGLCLTVPPAAALPRPPLSAHRTQPRSPLRLTALCHCAINAAIRGDSGDNCPMASAGRFKINKKKYIAYSKKTGEGKKSVLLAV